MAKNILIISAPFEGHIAGLNEIIKDLISLGHNITCYLLDKFLPRLEKSGAKIKTFKIGKIEIPPGNRPIFINILTIAKTYEEILSQATKLEEKYDYLIVDSILDGYEMNKVFKIPNLISLYTFPIVEVPTTKKGKEKRMKAFDLINEKYNINIKDVMELVFDKNAKYKFILTSKYFQPEINMLDDSYYFLGPSYEERPIDTSFTFKKDENKKLIYISFGTIFGEIDLFKKCIETFRNSKEFQIIMSIGINNNIKDLGDIPDNFHIYNHVPQLQVLKETDIFIAHGGLNSINEGIIIKNLPFIIIPLKFDQFGNAKQLEKLGAAIVLKKEELTEEVLKNAVNKILENEESYKTEVKKIAESYKEARAERKKIYEKIFV